MIRNFAANYDEFDNLQMRVGCTGRGKPVVLTHTSLSDRRAFRTTSHQQYSRGQDLNSPSTTSLAGSFPHPWRNSYTNR